MLDIYYNARFKKVSATLFHFISIVVIVCSILTFQYSQFSNSHKATNLFAFFIYILFLKIDIISFNLININVTIELNDDPMIKINKALLADSYYFKKKISFPVVCSSSATLAEKSLQ